MMTIDLNTRTIELLAEAARFALKKKDVDYLAKKRECMTYVCLDLRREVRVIATDGSVMFVGTTGESLLSVKPLELREVLIPVQAIRMLDRSMKAHKRAKECYEGAQLRYDDNGLVYLSETGMLSSRDICNWYPVQLPYANWRCAVPSEILESAFDKEIANKYRSLIADATKKLSAISDNATTTWKSSRFYATSTAGCAATRLSFDAFAIVMRFADKPAEFVSDFNEIISKIKGEM